MFVVILCEAQPQADFMLVVILVLFYFLCSLVFFVLFKHHIVSVITIRNYK